MISQRIVFFSALVALVALFADAEQLRAAANRRVLIKTAEVRSFMFRNDF